MLNSSKILIILKITTSLFLCLLVIPSAYAWECQQASSIRRDQHEYFICGIGEEKKESSARRKAQENAHQEFESLCNNSYDCKKYQYTIKPGRSDCKKTNGTYKCYRAFTYLINPKKTRGKLYKAPPTEHEEATDYEDETLLKNTIKEKRFAASIGIAGTRMGIENDTATYAEDFGVTGIALQFNYLWKEKFQFFYRLEVLSGDNLDSDELDLYTTMDGKMTYTGLGFSYFPSAPFHKFYIGIILGSADYTIDYEYDDFSTQESETLSNKDSAATLLFGYRWIYSQYFTDFELGTRSLPDEIGGQQVAFHFNFGTAFD
jgi:hypothetical protein